MELSAAIRARRSVRKFKKEMPVPAEHVHAMLEAAMMAPSALNTRPWEFYVVTDEATKQRLLQAHPACKMLETATLAIVVCGRPDLQPGRGFWHAANQRKIDVKWTSIRRKMRAGRLPGMGRNGILRSKPGHIGNRGQLWRLLVWPKTLSVSPIPVRRNWYAHPQAFCRLGRGGCPAGRSARLAAVAPDVFAGFRQRCCATCCPGPKPPALA